VSATCLSVNLSALPSSFPIKEFFASIYTSLYNEKHKRCAFFDVGEIADIARTAKLLYYRRKSERHVKLEGFMAKDKTNSKAAKEAEAKATAGAEDGKGKALNMALEQ